MKKTFNKAIGAGLSLLLTLSFATGSMAASFAAQDNNTDIDKGESETENQVTAYYNIFNGTVKDVISYYDITGEEVEGSAFVLAESDEGHLVSFLVTGDTYMITDGEIAVGSRFTGIYDAQAPVLMIYPPQYTAIAAAVDFPESDSIKADKFDENLISSDNMLKLNISDSTEIVHQDGTPFEDDIATLADRRMIVVYGVSTRSIPAQTTPIKIIVLREKVVEAPEPADISGTDIIVNNNKIEAPAPYTDNVGTIMLPLRAIAEVLGYEVSWNGEYKRIELDDNISLTLNQDLYNNSESDDITLGTAPVLVDNAHTYVPLDFFTTVLNIKNVRTAEGQIIINNIDGSDDIVVTID